MNATVQRARVYLDQGAVTWRVRVPATPDVPTVRFSRLPTPFEQGTLRAEAWVVSGSTRRPLEVVEVSTRRTAAPGDERRSSVMADLERLDAELAELDDEEGTDRFGLARLERYATVATRKMSVDWMEAHPGFDGWLEVFDRLRLERERLVRGRQQRQDRRQALQIEKADRLAELQALGENGASATEIDVGLSGDLDGEAWEVELTGHTPDAQWMPAYELRLSEDAAPMALLVGTAMVRQVTGQDWSDVELIATTARPPQADPPPAMRRLEVSSVPSDEDRTVISSHDEVARLAGMGQRTASRAIVEHSARATVAATGRAVRVELFSVELPLTTRLEVAPSLRTTAIQVAIIDNQAGAPLLPGTVSVFRGSNYLGQSQIGFVEVGEPFTVPVGPDRRVWVERRVHRSPPRRSSATGASTYDFTHSTMLENRSGDEVDIVVRDRTPISPGDMASVKIMERPAELSVDTTDGLTEARLRLAPQARRQLDLAYQITVSRDVGFEPPRDL